MLGVLFFRRTHEYAANNVRTEAPALGSLAVVVSISSDHAGIHCVSCGAQLVFQPDEISSWDGGSRDDMV